MGVARRTLFVVGRSHPKLCAWCGDGVTEEDRLALADGARPSDSHGICPECRAAVEAGEWSEGDESRTEAGR